VCRWPCLQTAATTAPSGLTALVMKTKPRHPATEGIHLAKMTRSLPMSYVWSWRSLIEASVRRSCPIGVHERFLEPEFNEGTKASASGETILFQDEDGYEIFDHNHDAHLAGTPCWILSASNHEPVFHSFGILSQDGRCFVELIGTRLRVWTRRNIPRQSTWTAWTNTRTINTTSICPAPRHFLEKLTSHRQFLHMDYLHCDHKILLNP
jgi:hypothetical protein